MSTRSEKRRNTKNKKKKMEIRDRKIREKRKKVKTEVEYKTTPNARIIKGLMRDNSIKGDYKDYVVLSGGRIIDWKGSYDAKTNKGETIGVSGLALVHKRDLRKFMPTDIAERFWHTQLGRLGAKIK